MLHTRWTQVLVKRKTSYLFCLVKLGERCLEEGGSVGGIIYGNSKQVESRELTPVISKPD